MNKSNIDSAERETVIYDGECSFCRKRIEEIRKLDKNNALEFLPRQDQSSEERFPQIVGINLDDGILCITHDGKTHVAAEAMYQIGRRLPTTRSWVWLYNVPLLKQVFQLAYKIIAANRRRLGQVCSDGLCKLP